MSLHAPRPDDRRSSSIGGQPHVLFLTTHLLSDETHKNWNTEIIGALTARHVAVTTTSFLSQSDKLDPAYIAETYTHVSFLLLGGYPRYHRSFMRLVRDVLPAAQRLNPGLRILNGPAMAKWNSDKSYMRDLHSAGIPIPESTILNPRQPFDYVRFAVSTQVHDHPMVIKPTISASGENTHLVRTPKAPTDDDDRFLRELLELMENGSHSPDRRPSVASGVSNKSTETEPDEGYFGSIMLQEFMPDVTKGEYSLVYVGQELQYTVLKVPEAGGWKINPGFGGTHRVLSPADVPEDAVAVSRSALEWLTSRFEDEFAYARVDGVLQEDGSFVLMGKHLCCSILRSHG